MISAFTANVRSTNRTAALAEHVEDVDIETYLRVVEQAVANACAAGRFQATVTVPLIDAEPNHAKWASLRTYGDEATAVLVESVRARGYRVWVAFWPSEVPPNYLQTSVTLQVSW